MIIRNGRDEDLRARRAAASTGLRRLTALAAVGGAASVMMLAGCGNGLQVAGPSGGSDTPVSTPSSSPEQSAGGDGSASASSSPTGAATAPSSGSASGPADDGSSGAPTSTGSSSDQPSSSESSSAATDGSSDQPSGPATTARSAVTCSLADLRVGIRPAPGGGAAGSGYALIDFTNKSGAPCWMYGYAGVSLVGHHDGTQLGQPAKRDRSQAARRIRLDAGEKTSELLQIANAENFPAKQCAPTTADGFRIYPPASTAAAFVPFETTACQGRRVTQLTVYPVGTKG
jgi:hypothetical protein